MRRMSALANVRVRRNGRRLLWTLTVAVLLGACEEPPPAPPPAPAEPQKDPAQLRLEARAKMEALREQNRDTMRAAGVGSVTHLKRAKDKLEMTFEFKNVGDKPLAQAEGAVAFFQGDSETPFKQIAIPFREPIAPGQTASKRGRFPIDEKDEGDKLLAETRLKDLTQKWMPKKYRFEDGTTLESD